MLEALRTSSVILIKVASSAEPGSIPGWKAERLPGPRLLERAGALLGAVVV